MKQYKPGRRIPILEREDVIEELMDIVSTSVRQKEHLYNLKTMNRFPAFSVRHAFKKKPIRGFCNSKFCTSVRPPLTFCVETVNINTFKVPILKGIAIAEKGNPFCTICGGSVYFTDKYREVDDSWTRYLAWRDFIETGKGFDLWRSISWKYNGGYHQTQEAYE